MQNDCSYCNWWGTARNGKMCVKCGKRANYVPPSEDVWPKSNYRDIEGTFADTRGTYAEYEVQYEPDAVHNFFGLTYASYLVLPRSVLQHMPEKWQNEFVKCLHQLHDMVELNDDYAVNLKDDKGKFKKDPLAQYRRFRKEDVPWRK